MGLPLLPQPASSNGLNTMKKENLPVKICAACGKPMTWRKKWTKVWDEVKYCSQRCRRNRPAKEDRR